MCNPRSPLQIFYLKCVTRPDLSGVYDSFMLEFCKNRFLALVKVLPQQHQKMLESVMHQ